MEDYEKGLAANDNEPPFNHIPWWVWAMVVVFLLLTLPALYVLS